MGHAGRPRARRPSCCGSRPSSSRSWTAGEIASTGKSQSSTWPGRSAMSARRVGRPRSMRLAEIDHAAVEQVAGLGLDRRADRRIGQTRRRGPQQAKPMVPVAVSGTGTSSPSEPLGWRLYHSAGWRSSERTFIRRNLSNRTRHAWRAMLPNEHAPEPDVPTLPRLRPRSDRGCPAFAARRPASSIAVTFVAGSGSAVSSRWAWGGSPA